MCTLFVLAAVDLRSVLILVFWSLIQNITFVYLVTIEGIFIIYHTHKLISETPGKF